MACSTKQILIDNLVNNKIAFILKDGSIAVKNPSSAAIFLPKILNSIYAMIPGVQLSGNLATLVGNKIEIDDDVADEIDEAIDARNKANNNVDVLNDPIMADSLNLEVKWEEYTRGLSRMRYRLRGYVHSDRIALQQSKDPVERAIINKRIYDNQRKIDDITDAINSIKDNPTLSKIVKSAVRDLQLIENSKDSLRTYKEINSAIESLEFYENLGSIDNSLAIDMKLARDENGELTEEAKEAFDRYLVPLQQMALRTKAELELKKQELVKQSLFATNQFSELFDKETFDVENMLFGKNGLPDASIFDSWVMDITNGIFSSNGLMPQLMQIQLDQYVNMAKQYDVRLELDLEKYQKKAEKALERMKSKFPNINGNGWSLLFNHTESGLREDGIIHVFSREYTNRLERINSRYRYDLKKAEAIKEPSRREAAITAAENKRIKSLQDISEVVNVNLIPELIQEGIVEGQMTDTAKNYKKMLIGRLGSFFYEQFVEDAKRKIRNYNEQKEILIKELMNNEGVEEQDKLSDSALKEIRAFDAEYNPKSYSSIYSTLIAKADSKFYNNAYSKLMQDQDIMNFYKVLYKNQQLIYDLLPPDKREKLGSFSLMSARSAFYEIASDPNMTLMAKISKMWKRLMDFIIQAFSKDEVSPKTVVNPITGKREYKVSDSFFNSNKEVIGQRTNEIKMQLFSILGINMENINEKIPIDRILSNPAAVKLLSDNLGIMASVSSLRNAIGSNIDSMSSNQLVYTVASHAIMKDQDTDLPKVLRIQLHQAAMYNARNEVLPILTAMKNEYENIKDQRGLKRENAIKQMESWFNRVVLDHYEDREDFTDDKVKIKKRFLTSADKEEKERLSKVRKNMSDALSRKDLTETEREKIEGMIEGIDGKIDNMGRSISFTSIWSGLGKLQRFVGLGYNLKSNITNYIEGQISNTIFADRGTYYNAEQLGRANKIMMSFTPSVMTFGRKMTDGARKARYMMKKFDVQQDASNELQKASRESDGTGIKAMITDPYFITQRTEFFNQTPVLISMMLNYEVTGENGQKSNAWDILGADGKVKEGFRTKENVETWETNESSKYFSFKAKIAKAIIDIHGDYHETHGNMASEYMTGKSVFMFKRWITRALYSRLGKEQYDLESGKKHKGRFLSMTAGQMAVMGALTGAFFSPVLGLLGLGLGTWAGLSYGLKTEASLLKDISNTILGILKHLIRLPVNGVTFNDTIKAKDMAVYGALDKMDIDNMKANLTDMAIQLSLVLALLIFKLILAGLSDDDDKDKEAEKARLNFLINQSMQLVEQASMWMSPTAFYKTTFSDISMVRYVSDVGKFAEELTKYSMGAGDGQKVWEKSMKLYAPSMARSGYLGLEASSRRVFSEWSYDELLKDDNKKADARIKKYKESYWEEMRTKYEEANDVELTEEEAEKLKRTVTKKFNKKKGESSEEQEQRLKDSGVIE